MTELSTTEKAQKFLDDNPGVIAEMVQMCRTLKQRGHKNYAIRGLFHVLRWRRATQTVDRFSEFKLNNNYSPYIARFIMDQYPEFEGFFNTRESGKKQGQDEFDWNNS